MKIFGIELGFDVVNATKQTIPAQNLYDVPEKVTRQIYRIAQDIGLWREALRVAESITNPNRYNLLRTYNDVILDAHVNTCIQQRKNLTLCREFVVLNKNGEENEELTKLLKSKWFRTFINLSLDSMFWGYSLIQFDNLVNNDFKYIRLVPRQFVKPEFQIVTKNYADLSGINYMERPYSDFCIGVGEEFDLGLLNKIAPYAIWKKNAFGAWAQYQEIFGSPIRIGKTSKRDRNSIENMETMLKNMGQSSWGRFDPDDMIELLEANKTDAHSVFSELIKTCNDEISKIIIGQTSTTSEKSFVGSANVHERILGSYGENDEYFIENVLNNQLVPMLENLGIKFNGAYIETKQDDELSLIDRSKIDLELLKTYNIPTDYIEETYGTPVEERDNTETNNINKVKNSIESYYK